MLRLPALTLQSPPLRRLLLLRLRILLNPLRIVVVVELVVVVVVVAAAAVAVATGVAGVPEVRFVTGVGVVGEEVVLIRSSSTGSSSSCCRRCRRRRRSGGTRCAAEAPISAVPLPGGRRGSVSFFSWVSCRAFQGFVGI